ncbi:hypothetical protein BH09ACT6_BH09ACT6_18760 [soil metagenome]
MNTTVNECPTWCTADAQFFDHAASIRTSDGATTVNHTSDALAVADTRAVLWMEREDVHEVNSIDVGTTVISLTNVDGVRLTVAKARAIGWALLSAAGELERVTGSTPGPVIEDVIDRNYDSGTPFEEVIYHQIRPAGELAAADGRHGLTDENGEWRLYVDALGTSLPAATARQYVTEIINLITTAENLNQVAL